MEISASAIVKREFKSKRLKLKESLCRTKSYGYFLLLNGISIGKIPFAELFSVRHENEF